MLKTKAAKNHEKTTTPKLITTARRRIALAVVGVLLLAGGAVLMVLEFRQPVDTGLRHGSTRLLVDYNLEYKPNDLYTQPKPGAKEARLLTYVKSVQFNLQYAMQGLQDLPCDYVVSAQAQLVAYASDTSKYIDPDFVIWQKDEELLAPENVAGTSSFERKINLDVNKFIDYAKSVYSKTQAGTTNELKVLFHVNATVQGPLGPVNDTTTVEYMIPMLDNVLVVQGTPTVENKVELRIAPPPDRNNYVPFALACFVLALGCGVWFTLLTLPRHKPDAESVYKKSVDRIFQQHGERLVRLENPLPYQQLATIPIDGIAEMVKIADEISQPVFYYRVDAAAERKIEFYVFDTGRIYYMVMFGDMGRESVATA